MSPTAISNNVMEKLALPEEPATNPTPITLVVGESEEDKLLDKDPCTLTPSELGKWGELVAYKFLEARGYTILSRNWRCAFGEVDIIAKENKPKNPKEAKQCVFFEVKTRLSDAFYFPAEAVTPEKQERYKNCVLAYGSEESETRFDVLSIVVTSEQGILLRHYINAFMVEQYV